MGAIDIGDARLLADAERGGGESPTDCAWLDARTIDDLDLPLVFGAIDRTTTPIGAQALWRWLVAPAQRLEPLAAREQLIDSFSETAARYDAREVIGEAPVSDAPHLPRLLYWTPPAPIARRTLALLATALAAAVLGAIAWHPLALIVVVLIGANLVIDDWANIRLAHQARALEVLGGVLATADRVTRSALFPDATRAALAADLAAVAPLRRRAGILAIKDPFQITDMLRSALLIRLFVLTGCATLIERERPRLRRIAIGIGELDAAIAIAQLRAERDDATVPELRAPGADRPALTARAIVHPAIAGAIGNDLELAGGGLILTGSNMSGKSTLMRAIAINAICAQSIHTVFGAWSAPLFRVGAVMRIADDSAAGASKYAVEVAAIGDLIAAAVARAPGDPPLLLAVDEPFGGTNPAIRVPIVVAVLTYLARDAVVLAATHDLEVAARLDDGFVRGYFAELPGTAAAFDRKLRPGVSPGTNAVELLAAAGYPAAILDAVALSVTPRQQ